VKLADRLGQPFYRSWVAGLHPMRALMQGRFATPSGLAREALAAAESAANWNGITASRVQLAWCWKDIGSGADRADEVERFVREEVLTRPLSGGAAAVWNGNLALFMAEAGLERRARDYVDRVADCDDTELTQNVDGRSGAALAAEACALLGDERLAPRFYELLLPRDGLCILGGRGVYFRGAAARYLGLLAATLGRAETPFAHLEDALETNTRAQAPPGSRAAGSTSPARCRPAAARRRAPAVDELQRAELLARSLGMRSLAARATSTAAQSTPRGARPASPGGACAARAQRVVDLVGAAGDVRPVEAGHVGRGLGDEAEAQRRVGQHPLHHLRQRARVARAEAQADVLVGDDLAQAAGVGHDARAAAGHRLERHEPNGS
jgi:hypothetical protein